MSVGVLPAVAARLAALRMRYGLSADIAEQLAVLLAVLESDGFAPTTVTQSTVAVDQHIADSLVALELPEVRAANRVADLGAGAGFPGLVLAVALPGAAVSLVESNGRKCGFLERAIAATAASNVVVVNDRAETWVAGRGVHDLVAARALAPLPVVAEYAAPLLRMGGSLIAWTGKREPQLEDQTGRAAEMLGLSRPRATPVAPFSGAQHRHLHVMSKLRDTPALYPRRPGIARKRPLGGSTGPVI